MHCWARYLFIAVVTVLGVGQMIAACGQKGDLYLPEPEAPKQTPIPTKGDDTPEIQTGEELEVEMEQEAADTPAAGKAGRIYKGESVLP